MAFNCFQWTISSFISEPHHNIKETPSCRCSLTLLSLFTPGCFFFLLILNKNDRIPDPPFLPASYCLQLFIYSPVSFAPGGRTWHEVREGVLGRGNALVKDHITRAACTQGPAIVSQEEQPRGDAKARTPRLGAGWMGGWEMIAQPHQSQQSWAKRSFKGGEEFAICQQRPA